MCGRFVVARATSDLVALFDVDVVGDALAGESWNIAPTDRVNVVIDTLPRQDPDGEPVRRLEAARWGLVPPWAESVAGPPMINARSETVTTTRLFADAVVSRRAFVPASGYYEWTIDDGRKTPRFVQLADNELMLFAAVYSWWRNPSPAPDTSPWLLSTAVLTREATGPLAAVHDRMPVLLPAEFAGEWLDPHEEGGEELVAAVVDAAADVAERAIHHEVGPDVGDVRNDSPALAEPVGAR
jgi:putative SOS response-associated peptidase YedK